MSRALPGSDTPPTLMILRIAALVAWGWITAATLVQKHTPGAGLLETAGLLAFLAALWLALLRVPQRRVAAPVVGWLLVQMAVSVIVSTDLMLLVALELPLVLPRKVAAWAFATLMTVLVVVGIALAQLGGFSAAPEYAGMSPTLQVIMTLGTVAGWELLAFAGGLLAATEILARQQADQLASELRIVQRRLEESSREAERLHIARELHDTIGHGLAALGVHLDMQSRRADGDAAAAFREARDASRDLLSEVRDVVSAMRREGPLDLKRSIAELLSGFTVPRVEFTVSPELHLDQAAGAHALLRCAQEGLTNVLRHSHATRVWLDLAQDERGVTLRLRDDGVGMNSAPEGNGLRGMRERLEAVGGSLRIAASPGTGVNLEAWVPGTSMKP